MSASWRKCNHVARDVPGDGEIARERDHVSFDRALDPHGSACGNQVIVNRFARGNGNGLPAPHFRRRGLLRQRQSEQQRRHDHGNRHGTPQTAPDPSERHDRHQNQSPDLYRVNHVTPSFPESSAEHNHAEDIRSAKACIAQLIDPGADSVGPKPVRARRKNSKCQRPRPGRQAPRPAR